MAASIGLLLISTASVGAVHTLLGPDHYLPFIALSKTRAWSIRKTALITGLCGAGHILSAVALGLLAAWFGSNVVHIENIESARGELAAWLLTAFGFGYAVWGLRAALRSKTQTHDHGDGIVHTHLHPHASEKDATPWLLFIIFFFGPCEPLIPLVLYPASSGDISGVLLVTAIFGAATVAVMLAVVLASSLGLKKMLDFPFFTRWGHALSGTIIGSCGLAITFLGL